MSSLVSKLTEIRKDKLVGILITNKAQIFSNGITQNAYFIHQCLENLGLKCQFLCTESNPTNFAYKDLPLKQISLNPLEFDPSDYHTIITVTRGLTTEEYMAFKKAKVHIVAFVCGNQVMHHMEDFVRGPITPGTSTYIGKSAMSDEIWLIPSYEHSREYISVVRSKPVFLVPHLWSPLFIKNHAETTFKSSELSLFYDGLLHTGKKIDIIILEPNFALFKNAWLPLVSSEKLFQEDNNLIENVYVFNFPSHGCSRSMTEDLSVSKKIRYFKRLAMPEIMLHFNKKGTFPIILSHQVLNSLNYLYYEALFYGWPIVHNSADLDGCGYFYPENDIGACARAIKEAYVNHNKNLELYKEKALKFLERVDPLNSRVGEIWNGYINDGIAKAL